MSKEAFNRTCVELEAAIKELSQQGHTIATFLLIYTSIDILSSLARPVTEPDTNRSFYKGWVDQFMLPGSGLPCNADDIYAARCGVLHTLTAESREARFGNARMINYVGTASSADDMQRRHDPSGAKDVFVSTDAFIRAFFSALNEFRRKVEAAPDLQQRVYHHAGTLMATTRDPLR